MSVAWGGAGRLTRHHLWHDHLPKAALPEGRRGHVAAFGGASGAEYRGTPTKLAGKYTSLGAKQMPEGSWWFA